MALLAPGIPHETDSPFVEVENVLPPGRHRFRLTVLDSSKNESGPTFLVVTVNEVQRDPRPDPRVDPRVILDRVVIDRGGRNPGIGDFVRPPGPFSRRQPRG